VHLIHDRDDVAAGLLAHTDAHARLAVEAGDDADVLGPVLDAAHVAQVDGRAVSTRHDQTRELLDVAELGDRPDAVLHRFALDETAGALHVLPSQRGQHVAGGEAAGAELVAVEPDPDVAVASTEERDPRDLRDGLEDRLDLPSDVLAGVDRRPLGLEGQPQDGLVVGVEVPDDGGVHLGRQQTPGPRHLVPDLLGHNVEVRAEDELHRDDRRAVK
jgi:hypothetical protein